MRKPAGPNILAKTQSVNELIVVANKIDDVTGAVQGILEHIDFLKSTGLLPFHGHADYEHV